MIEKIKAFFAKKPVIVTEGCLIAVASLGLEIAGLSATESVPKIVTCAVGALVAVEAVITVIQGLSKK